MRGFLNHGTNVTTHETAVSTFARQERIRQALNRLWDEVWFTGDYHPTFVFGGVVSNCMSCAVHGWDKASARWTDTEKKYTKRAMRLIRFAKTKKIRWYELSCESIADGVI